MPLVPWVQPLLQFGHLRDRLLALRRDEGHAECRERLAIHPERPAGLDVLWTVAAAIGDDDLFVVLVNERHREGATFPRCVEDAVFVRSEEHTSEIQYLMRNS